MSSLWSIAFQQNNYLIKPFRGEDERWNSNLNSQPVLPVAINENWNLITRPVVTAFNSVPHPRQEIPQLEWARTETFGDTVLAAQYMVARPDEFGQKWNFQLMVVPVLPKLIHGTLAEPGSLEFGLPKR